MNWTKSYLFSTVLSCMACGGQSADITNVDDTLPDDSAKREVTQQELDEAFEGAPIVPILSFEEANGSNPNYIDRITYGEEKIDFIEVHSEEYSPFGSSIIIYRSGPAKGGDIVDSLYAAADVVLTPAEIWMNIMKSDAVPTTLLTHHLQHTRNTGRTLEFIILDKVVTPLPIDLPDPSDLENGRVEKDFVDDMMYPNIPGHTWPTNRRRRQGVDMSNLQPRYNCSEVKTDNNLPLVLTGVATQQAACSTKYNEGGWVRIGAYNTSFNLNDMGGIACYGPSNLGAWACHPPDAFSQSEFAIWDWVTTEAQKKRMALNINPIVHEFPFYSTTFTAGKAIPQ